MSDLNLKLILEEANKKFKEKELGYFAETTKEHVYEVAHFMRKVDVFECACMGQTPLQALQHALNNGSITASWVYNDNPVMIAGVVPSDPVPYIWVLGTNDVETIPIFKFIRVCKHWKKVFTSLYPLTHNFVYKENHHAIKWLKLLGAKFISKRNIFNYEFLEFIIQGD